MSAASDGNDDTDLGVSSRNIRARRDITHWALDLQPFTMRPAACRSCGDTFVADELRMCPYAERSNPKWKHPACILPEAAAEITHLTPVGRATQENVVAARTQLHQPAPNHLSQMRDNLSPLLDEDVARRDWHELRLPNRNWWRDLDLNMASRTLRQTFIQVPDRLHGALTAARGKLAEVLAEARARNDALAEWKAFLLFDAMLLAHGRAHATCSDELEERLQWFWGGQWKALWSSSTGASTPPPSARSAASDKQTARRVQTLAASGEEGRALAAATAGKLAPRTPETLIKIKAHFDENSADNDMRDVRGPRPSDDLRQEVKEEVAKLLSKPARLTSPGLLGSRLEHLATCRDDQDTFNLLCEAVVCITFGDVPQEILDTLRTGEVVGKQKGEDDVRPLIISSTLRRLGLRALVRVRREKLRDAAGDNQYGVGRATGAQLLKKKLDAQTELRPDATVIKIDLKSAFQNVPRAKALQTMMEADAEVAEVLRVWYQGRTTHLWRDALGRFAEISSNKGFDQGCPLAASAFSIVQTSVLDPFMQQLRMVDPMAKVYSYLDDTYLVVAKEHAALALAGLEEAFGRIGLQLNPAKTKVWSPAGRAAIQASLIRHYTDTLPVLGAGLGNNSANVEEPLLRLGGEPTGLTQVTQRLKGVWQTLSRLQAAGLTRQAVAALLKNYAGAASQYTLQLETPRQNEVEEYDNLLTECWQTLADRTLTQESKERLGLPQKMGGCGVQYASTRRHAAFWRTACVTLEEVATDAGFPTAASFLEAAPQYSAKLEAARQGLAQQGLALSEGAPLADALHRSNWTQSLIVGLVQKRKQNALLRSLSEACAANLRGSGGPGAASFMQFPTDATCSIEDCLWSVSLRKRLGLKRAEASDSEILHAKQTCCCISREGRMCNAALDENGTHAEGEQYGGGVLKRHNRLKKVIGSLVKRWTQQEPLYEQRVPAWDRARRSSGGANVELAILDIEYSEDGGRRWIDVTVRQSAAGPDAATRAAAKKDGEATRRAEREKHVRYPGQQLTPFAVETPGRIGAEARFWLLAMVRELPADIQSSELSRAYRAISCAVQSEAAKQLRRAAGLK